MLVKTSTVARDALDARLQCCLHCIRAIGILSHPASARKYTLGYLSCSGAAAISTQQEVAVAGCLGGSIAQVSLHSDKINST